MCLCVGGDNSIPGVPLKLLKTTEKEAVLYLASADEFTGRTSL